MKVDTRQWKMVKLEDVCYILDNKRIPVTAENRIKGTYPYYGANGVQDYVSNFIFDDELVLLAEDGGNFGSKDKPIAYRISGKCWVNNHAHVLKPKSNIDVNYLCYSLMFYDVSGIINGATRQKLNQDAMRKMQIPLPLFEVQKQIADTLDKANRLIELRKQQLEKLDLLIKSKFIDMFGDPVTNPIGWEVEKLQDVCLKITDGTHQSPSFVENGIPFLFVSNIVENKITYETTKFITRQEYQTLIKRTPIEIGDLLLTIVGSYGNPAIVETEKEFCFQRHIAYLKPKREKVSSVYLHSAFISPYVKKQIDERVKGVAQKTLNLSELKSIEVQLPPLALQNQFTNFVEQVEKQKSLMQKGQKKLEINFKALMQKYFW